MSSGELYAPGSVLPAAEIRTRIAAHLGEPLVPDVAGAAAGSNLGPSRYFRGERGVVGIISAMSEHFCDTCNRVRLTSTGALHTCLAHDDAVDLRTIVRSGGVDGDVEHAIRQSLGVKRAGHEFTQAGGGGPRKSMVSIGG